jgi:hypothetical protein
MSRINQRLNGIDPLSYVGVDAYQPNDFIMKNRDPLTTDYNNFSIGTWWLNTDTNSLFFLAALANGIATWINISEASGAVETLTGNSGGAVGPTAGNVNVLGDGSTISIIGNPGTNTLTISAILATPLSTLTGNSGGAVSPTMGNINILGSSGIIVAGNPGTSTLTVTPSTTAAISFVTQSGTATPAAGALTINGASGLTTTGAGNTVTVANNGSLTTSFITSPATGTATPAAGVITFAAGANTTISAAGSTVTVNNTGAGGGGPSYTTGTFTPNFTINGTAVGITYSTQFGAYARIGNIVFMNTLIETNHITNQGLITIPSFPIAPALFSTSSTAVMNNAITITKYNYISQDYDVAMLGFIRGSFSGATTVNVSSNNSGNVLSMSTTGFYFV